MAQRADEQASELSDAACKAPSSQMIRSGCDSTSGERRTRHSVALPLWCAAERARAMAQIERERRASEPTSYNNNQSPRARVCGVGVFKSNCGQPPAANFNLRRPSVRGLAAQWGRSRGGGRCRNHSRADSEMSRPRREPARSEASGQPGQDNMSASWPSPTWPLSRARHPVAHGSQGLTELGATFCPSAAGPPPPRPI